MKKALIFGASGQAGSYLVEQLLEKGYEVHGTSNNHTINTKLTKSWVIDFNCRSDEYDWDDSTFRIHNVISKVKPDEIYNMASIMFAPNSWKNPREVIDVNGSSVVTILEAICKYCPQTHFVQAGSADSELLDSPYAVAKNMAKNIVKLFREKEGLHASTAIFYNMESPRRSDFFFSRKVIKEIVNYLKTKRPFHMGPLAAVRDWGWTPEYMEAVQLMAKSDKPDDYVIATGESHSCRDFIKEALYQVGEDPNNFERYCIEDKTLNTQQTRMYSLNGMEVFPIMVTLGWKAKTKFEDVIKKLLEAEHKRQQREELLI